MRRKVPETVTVEDGPGNEQTRHSQDTVHRCADFMTHKGQESTLGFVGLLRLALFKLEFAGAFPDLVFEPIDLTAVATQADRDGERVVGLRSDFPNRFDATRLAGRRLDRERPLPDGASGRVNGLRLAWAGEGA